MVCEDRQDEMLETHDESALKIQPCGEKKRGLENGVPALKYDLCC
jgi:hypothetical protein